MDRARVALALAAAGSLPGVVLGASCPGTVQLVSDETDAPLPVSFVPTGWGSPDGGAEFEVDGSGNAIPHMGSRAYFAMECTPGEYDNKQYIGMNLLGRTLRYTVDLSGAGCGCNAAFYLTSMNLNKEKSECGDHYCDANSVCGESCAEIDIQEANKYAWHSTLHTAGDSEGMGGGYGGGEKDWNGPRDWNATQYAPGGECIDTSEPFQVAASFPVNAKGGLTGMVVVLSQAGHPCTLKTSITFYEGMEELSRAVRAGMTPVVSYWSDDDMLWMDGLGKDKQGPCHSDSAVDCSETVKFFNFSVGDLDAVAAAAVAEAAEAAVAVPAAPAAGPDKASDGFCCLASSGASADFCGQCFPAGRALPGSVCGRSESDCQSCGGQATWCEEAAVQPAADSDVGEEGQCCLAAMDLDDFCGTCFPNAVANASSRCGGSRASCEDCGGGSRWCGPQPKGDRAAAHVLRGLEKPGEEGAEAEPFDCKAGLAKWESGWSGTKKTWCCEVKGSPCPETTAAAETTTAAAETTSLAPEVAPKPSNGTVAASFCCLASSDADDLCGSCLRPAGSGQAATYDALDGGCRTEDGGLGSYSKIDGLDQAGCQSACTADATCVACEYSEHSCKIHTAAIAYAETVSGPMCYLKRSQDEPCGSDESSCRACSKKAHWCSPEAPRGETTAAAPAEAEGAGKGQGDDPDDSFCCLAAFEASDVCGTCFENARAERSSHCGASAKTCGECGGASTWCSAAGGAKEQQREGPASSNASARAEEEPAAAGFCCLAAEESGGHFCGSCFPNARAQAGSHCSRSRAACKSCAAEAKWCDAPPSSDATGGEAQEAEAAGAGGTGAASKTSTSGAPKPSTTSATSKDSTTGAASRDSTTGAASKSSAASAAPEPACPGMVQIQSDGLSDLPAQIVPTGWGSEYGPVPVQVANYSTIDTKMGARAYFAMSCTAGVYSNQDYMALNLLGRSLRYTVDLSGAGCGCNAALYLTSMRQNTNASSCSDHYCDANSVCGVACAEIDIQEANMHSWHSTLHGQDDPDGVGGGFGGGGEEWNGPRDWNASQYSPGGTCIDTRRPFDVDAAFPVDAEGALAGMVVTLSQAGRSCPLSTLTVAYAGMPELTEALQAGMTPIVSYWNADDMLWMDGKGKDKLGACKSDRPDRCAESVRFSNFSVGIAPTLPPTAAPTPEPTAEPTAAPTPSPTRPAGFCCLAAPNPFDYCGSCPGFAMAPEGSDCAASEDSCNQCGGLSKWCEIEDSTPETVTTSRAPKRSKEANVKLGAKDVVAEVIGKPNGGDSGSDLQGKYGASAFTAAPRQLQRLAPFLCLPGLIAVAFASLAWLRRRRRAEGEADADPLLSSRPMVQGEDSELDLA